MNDSVFRTRSLGVAASGISDQYADGKAAKVWELYIGCKNERTDTYRNWLCSMLRDRGCKTVLDAACGTGVDSIVLIEEGFSVVSTDASDKMLKYALKERWERRKDERFDKWVVDEANWLNLVEDIGDIEHKPCEKFDAVLCLGNSFAHLPDFHGDQRAQKQALEQMRDLVKPGGILVVDHRNYDAIVKTGQVPQGKNVYYNSGFIDDIKCSNLYVNGLPTLVTLDYRIDVVKAGQIHKEFAKLDEAEALNLAKFRLSYYPHLVEHFEGLLKECFGPDAHHVKYGDFEEIDESKVPAYYIHIIQKPK